MKQIIMTEDSFNEHYEGCLDTALEDTENTNKYLAEIDKVMRGNTTYTEKWAKLIDTEVFKETYGEWEKVEGNCLYLND